MPLSKRTWIMFVLYYYIKLWITLPYYDIFCVCKYISKYPHIKICKKKDNGNHLHWGASSITCIRVCFQFFDVSELRVFTVSPNFLCDFLCAYKRIVTSTWQKRLLRAILMSMGRSRLKRGWGLATLWEEREKDDGRGVNGRKSRPFFNFVLLYFVLFRWSTPHQRALP